MYAGKTILITGGTGSLGQCLVERFLQTEVRRVIVYSRDEYKQYHMDQKFAAHRDRLRYFIGDVRDKARLQRALAGVDYVIHAAALKHVHLMEYNPNEAVQTNILGSMNVLDAAIDCGVSKVITLSTDKAVNPVNLYGATKLVSDKLFRAAHSYSGENGPCFVVVRYGNVVGSRGSVVPYFQSLARDGAETLPITDKRMTRFWITMPQAVGLVVRALETGGESEIFLGKIPSCNIADLARAIHPTARLVEIGIRPGEKLHEAMLTEDEARSTYDYDDHYVVYPLGVVDRDDNRIRPGGQLVPRDFRYASELNVKWLDEKQLVALLREMQPSARGSAEVGRS